MRTINEIKRTFKYEGSNITVKKELYQTMIIKCKKNKSKTCYEQILPYKFTRQKINIDDDDNLYYYDGFDLYYKITEDENDIITVKKNIIKKPEFKKKYLNEYQIINSKLFCINDINKIPRYEKIRNDHIDFLAKHKLNINKFGKIECL
tara:strand:+ start:73 stop:519 length:447 start_codon:yes stop_codon:yes gene_type:complete